MLTLKLITEETERVIKGLEKKHYIFNRSQCFQIVTTLNQNTLIRSTTNTCKETKWNRNN